VTPWAVLAVTLAATPPGPIDETFDLDITERVIEQQVYDRGEVLRVEGQGLSVAAGVRLAAGTLRVLLRNVHGRVRFHADLGPLTNVLSGRAAARAPAPPNQGGSP
jgi:hypothetical protein